MDLSGNFYLTFILSVLLTEYLLDLAIELLNLRNLKSAPPAEFEGAYDAAGYAASRRYERENTIFGICSASFALAFLIVFITKGGFEVVDSLARSLGRGPVTTGLIFALLMKAIMDVLELPFEIYDTFVIEEKYGFNKTSAGTFILDFLKEWGLTLAIGAPAFAAVLWFFETYGAGAWLYVWAFMTVFQLFMAFVSPAILLPVFNKFTPLAGGPLKTEIETYAAKERFKISGIFSMDGSKRSSKTNAFFTGFGRFRRIALFDTLIAKTSPEEVTAVLAHEMGHYKKRHILLLTALGIAQTGFMLWLLSFFMGNKGLFSAFGVTNLSVYASLVFFGFLYSPVNFFLGIFMNWLSRKHELEADAYAARTYGRPEALISALKKMAVDNFSNLTPHPLKVLIKYSHPPVIDRIRSLRSTL